MFQIANAPAKREVFTWNAIYEELLLQEVLPLEPFQYRQGSKETKIAVNLSEMGMKAIVRGQ